MNTTPTTYVALYILSYTMVGIVSCTAPTQPQTLEALEQSYKDMLNGNPVVDPDTLRAVAQELGKKYLEQVAKDSLTEDAPRYLYKAASLYELGFMDPNYALVLYDRLLQNYPNSAYVPEALFKTGFIYHNTLNDLVKAKETFEAFIQRFPDHELSVPAQSEVENLGLSPDSILRKIMKQDTLP